MNRYEAMSLSNWSAIIDNLHKADISVVYQPRHGTPILSCRRPRWTYMMVTIIERNMTIFQAGTFSSQPIAVDELDIGPG